MLKGLKVIEYATYIAAPGAGGILCDWGADVIKIEPPGGDPIRKFFATIGAETADNPVFDLDNRGKRSIELDIATDEGREALLKLIDGADVFLTNVRPGGLERAGLDFAPLHARNPRLIYASVTGYGLEGEEKDRPGFDMAAFWSRAGLASLFAPKGAEPFPIRTATGDHICSMATAAGILAALHERHGTGKGRLVETSLVRAATYSISSDLAIQLRFGRLASTRPREDAINPLANFFKTGDGHWLCALPRQGEADWAKLCLALDAQDLESEPQFAKAKNRRENGRALIEALDVRFAAFTLDEIASRLDAQDFVWAPVQTAQEAVKDRQLHAAGCFTQMTGPDGTLLATPATPVRFPGEDDGPKSPSPRRGEHTEVILAGLGFSPQAIARARGSERPEG
jgi:crotonobetainyl-CoA:carnitine CoA-transferase CaiB-like acyl-CoA transferase